MSIHLLALSVADATAPTRLLALAPVDMVIIAVYFAMVLGIGFYLKKYTKTGDDFFLAGREMTAWVAGLSFLAANLGALELMGWAAAAYQYGILATHWYWIGAIPAMLFLGIVMMPFYYISKTHSVPGYLKLRFGEPSRALSAITFGFMTVLMSGINMYSMALVMKVVLGWDINFSIWVSSITVAVYVGLGGLLSAIFNEVLQFVLIWMGALLISIIGLIETGGWNGMVARIHANFPGGDYTHLWRTMGSFTDNPMGIHWTGIVLGLGLGDLVRLLDHGFPGRPARARRQGPPLGEDGADHRRRLQDGGAVHRHPAGPARPRAAAEPKLMGEAQAVATGGAQLQRSAAADAGALLRPRPARPRHHGADRGVHVGHGRQRDAFATVWTYDIYKALFKQGRHRRALRVHGALVHDSRRAGEHRHGVPGDAVPEHHGLRAGAVQLLHRAAVRHRAARHAVEAGYARGRVLGAAGRHAVLDRHVGLGEAGPDGAAVHRAVRRRASDMAENMYRALWSWIVCVVVTVVVSLLTKPKPESELTGLVYGCTDVPGEGHLPLYQRPAFWAVRGRRRVRRAQRDLLVGNEA